MTNSGLLIRHSPYCLAVQFRHAGALCSCYARLQISRGIQGVDLGGYSRGDLGVRSGRERLRDEHESAVSA
jgi:hypothetical protein